MYEWDEEKRRANLAKHGLDFSDAERINWDRALHHEDDYIDGEVRVRVLVELDLRVVNVVYTLRNERVRLISMRRATRIETRMFYDE